MKQIKIEQKVSEAKKLASNNMRDAKAIDAFNTLIVGKETENLGNKIFKKAKNYIENELTPADIIEVLEVKDLGSNKAIGEFISYETLFGVEYEIGGHQWVIERGAKKGLLASAAVNPAVKAVIINEPTIDYSAIKNILKGCSSMADVPFWLVSFVSLKPTENTVHVSSIKDVKK